MYAQQLIELASREKKPETPKPTKQKKPFECDEAWLRPSTITGKECSPLLFRVNKYQLGQCGCWYCFDLKYLLILLVQVFHQLRGKKC